MKFLCTQVYEEFLVHSGWRDEKLEWVDYYDENERRVDEIYNDVLIGCIDVFNR